MQQKQQRKQQQQQQQQKSTKKYDGYKNEKVIEISNSIIENPTEATKDEYIAFVDELTIDQIEMLQNHYNNMKIKAEEYLENEEERSITIEIINNALKILDITNREHVSRERIQEADRNIQEADREEEEATKCLKKLNEIKTQKIDKVNKILKKADMCEDKYTSQQIKSAMEKHVREYSKKLVAEITSQQLEEWGKSFDYVLEKFEKDLDKCKVQDAQVQGGLQSTKIYDQNNFNKDEFVSGDGGCFDNCSCSIF